MRIRKRVWVVLVGLVTVGSLVSLYAGWMMELWGWLNEPATPNNWQLMLIGIGPIAALAFLLLWGRARGAKSIRRYNTDIILGIRWEWEYGKPGKIENLVPYCPRCGFQLATFGLSKDEKRVQFFCELCRGGVGAEMRIAQGEDEEKTFGNLVSLAHRKVLQNIRDRAGLTHGTSKAASPTD